ncbi:unnamed protein product [Closterium sp. Yama58-4]|nr:unnamed protein product [Closterium sp. Yama58-4]
MDEEDMGQRRQGEPRLVPAGMPEHSAQEPRVQQGEPGQPQEQGSAVQQQQPASCQESAHCSEPRASPRPACQGIRRATAAPRLAPHARDRDLPTSHRGLRDAHSGTRVRGDAEENLAPAAPPHCLQQRRDCLTPRAAAQRAEPAQTQERPAARGRGRRPPLSPAQGHQQQPGQVVTPQAAAALQARTHQGREHREEVGGLAGEQTPLGLGPSATQRRRTDPGEQLEQQEPGRQGQQDRGVEQARSQRCALGPPLTSPLLSPSQRTRRQQALEDARLRQSAGEGNRGGPQLAAASARSRGGRAGGRGRGREDDRNPRPKRVNEFPHYTHPAATLSTAPNHHCQPRHRCQPARHSKPDTGTCHCTTYGGVG